MNKTKNNDVDVVVVGSGATGGWVCKTLCEAGHQVLLLEAGPAIDKSLLPEKWYQTGDQTANSGDESFDSSRQQVQKNHPAYCAANHQLWIDDVNHPYSTDSNHPFTWIRARLEGGRSNLWGGQCWRLTEHEINGPNNDGNGIPWPLNYEDLVPYYEQVEQYQHLSGQIDNSPTFPNQIVNGQADLTSHEHTLKESLHKRRGYHCLPVRTASNSRKAYGEAGNWPRFSSIGSTLSDALETGNLTIIHDAVVTELETSDDGQQVQSVHYLDANTGKESKQTARYFILCASTIESTRILLNSTSANHPTGLGNGSGTLGRYLMDHLGYVAIGNVEPPSEQQQGVFFGGRQGLYLPHFHLNDNNRDFIRGYAMWTSLGRPMGEGLNAIISSIGEMLPYHHNGITLSSHQVDKHGIPIPHIHCVLGENEKKMQAHQRRSLLQLSRIAGIELATEPSAAVLGAMVHEVGTARMGSDPTTSYCNSYAQSWEVPNVFIPDGSCWSTSAFQNPTLTFMAISVRCAMHVAKQLDLEKEK